jgi:hypothetical protein
MEGYHTWDSNLIACTPIDMNEKYVTKCVEDTCLVLLLAAAQDIQSLGLESSSVAHSLINRQTGNKKQQNK